MPIRRLLSGATAAPRTRVRLLIVDEEAALRDGLAESLGSELSITVIAAVGSMREAITISLENKPAIIVTETRAGGGSIAELMSALEAVRPPIGVIVLTSEVGEATMRQALSAGVRAYLSKQDGYSELLEALRVVGDGRRFLSDSIETRIIGQYAEQVTAQHLASGAQLTPREREVLVLVGLGQANKEVARTLNLSVKTVEKHRANLMHKLGLHRTAALTIYAIRHGLIGTTEQGRSEAG